MAAHQLDEKVAEAVRHFPVLYNKTKTLKIECLGGSGEAIWASIRCVNVTKEYKLYGNYIPNGYMSWWIQVSL